MGLPDTVAAPCVHYEPTEPVQNFRTEGNVIDFRVTVVQDAPPMSENTTSQNVSATAETLEAIKEARSSSLDGFATTDDLFDYLDS